LEGNGFGAVFGVSVDERASTGFSDALHAMTFLRQDTPQIHGLAYGADHHPRVAYLAFPSETQIGEVGFHVSRWDGSAWMTTSVEPSDLVPHQSNMAVAHEAATDATLATYVAWRYPTDLNFVLTRVPPQGPGTTTTIEAGDPLGSEGMPGIVSDLVVDQHGIAHVAYIHEHYERFFTGEIKYARDRVRESVEDGIEVSDSIAIAVTSQGTPVVGYVRADANGARVVRLMERSATGWTPLPSPPSSTSVSNVDLAIAHDVLYVAYRDAEGVHLATRALL
jgi:hypothetical protein